MKNLLGFNSNKIVILRNNLKSTVNHDREIKPFPAWKTKLHEIIYEADTKQGKLFDVILIISIIISIVLVMLESVENIDEKYHNFLNISEWVITILFTIEYIARIICLKKPSTYIFSFYGIIDFLATIPKYLSIFLIGSHALVALRALRLLRVFRILKLARYLGESATLITALKASRYKISVFLFSVIVLTIILGTVMYLVEGPDHGFNSIPHSMYWAIVTLTTVGYGDIAPQTPFGQFIASIVMILGYGIIAVPTGIVTSEITRADSNKSNNNTQHCCNCSADIHIDNAKFCHKCGENLNHE